MRARSAAVLATVWALTVVGVAFITWQVIHTAGRDILDESSVPEQTQGTGPTPSVDSVWRPAHPRTPRPGSGSPTPETSPAAPSTSTDSTPAPSSHPTSMPSQPGMPDGPSNGPSHSSSTGGDHGSHDGSHHDTPSPSPTPGSLPAPSVVDSWRGEAGVVTVGCDPRRIRLLGASPANGYRVEVEQEEDEVQVHFEREEPEDEVQLVARCVDGVPRFEVEQDDRSRDEPAMAPLTS